MGEYSIESNIKFASPDATIHVETYQMLVPTVPLLGVLALTVGSLKAGKYKQRIG